MNIKDMADKYHINWLSPNFSQDAMEYINKPYIYNILSQYRLEFDTIDKFIKFLKENGDIMTFTRQEVADTNPINITTSPQKFNKKLWNPEQKKSFYNMFNNLKKLKQIDLPMPIYIKLPDGRLFGLSGDKRSNLAWFFNLPVTAWVVDASKHLFAEATSRFNIILEKALTIKTFDYPSEDGKLKRGPMATDRILYFGTAKHPTTGNTLAYGIDLDTLTPDDLAILMKPEYLEYAWKASDPIQRRDRLIDIINKNEKRLKPKGGVGEEGSDSVGYRLLFKRGPSEYHEKRRVPTPEGEELVEDPHYSRTSSWKSFYVDDIKNREVILLDLNSFRNVLKQLNKLGPDYTFNNLSDDYLRKASESKEVEPINPDDIVYDQSEEEENIKTELVDEEPIKTDEIEKAKATEVEPEPEIDVKMEPETDIETGKVKAEFEQEQKSEPEVPDLKIMPKMKKKEKPKGFRPKLDLSMEPLVKNIDKRLSEIEQSTKESGVEESGTEEPSVEEPEELPPKQTPNKLSEMPKELEEQPASSNITRHPKSNDNEQEVNEETPDIIGGSQIMLNKVLELDKEH